jgi:hypothetical protein
LAGDSNDPAAEEAVLQGIVKDRYGSPDVLEPRLNATLSKEKTT